MAMDRGWAINIGWFLSVIFSPTVKQVSFFQIND